MTVAKTLRIMFFSITALQLAVLCWPGSSPIDAYPKAYTYWAMVGDSQQWPYQFAVIVALGWLALFEWRWCNELIRTIAAFCQFILFLSMGLFFALTIPPQVGVSYISVSAFAAWLSYRSWFRGE